jgi:hypothetical protein
VKRRKEIRKEKFLRMRMTDKLSSDFDEYCKKNNTTKTKVIEKFLEGILYGN